MHNWTGLVRVGQNHSGLKAGFEQASMAGDGVINAGKPQTMPGKRVIG
jgi:hypothetical protein